MVSNKFEFYAVVDDSGVVTIKHPLYESLKGVFRNREDAEMVLLNNPSAPLRIDVVNIVGGK